MKENPFDLSTETTNVMNMSSFYKDPIVEPHEKRYCSHCGILCIEQLLGAETNMMFYGEQSTIPLAHAYDKKTGKRNYCYHYICPNYKKRKWFEIWSPHDKYFVDKVINI